jgi:hypothetical protein
MCRCLASSLLIAGALLVARGAGANCADGPYYSVEVVDQKVVICLEGLAEYEDACSYNGGMLRENVETGEIVRLGVHHYSDTDGVSGLIASPLCCLDECVPPGKYRYGLAVPYECTAGCGPTPYYEAAEVAADGACTPCPGNPGASAYAGDAPWEGDGDGLVCEDDSGFGPFSCAIAHPGARAVFGFNAAFALLGLGLLVWRRARRGR